MVSNLSKPSITSRAIEIGMPQLVRDTNLDPDYLTAPGMAVRFSALAIPIIVAGHPFAILNVEDDRPSAFTEADLSLIQILVGQISSALERIIQSEEDRRRRETHLKELLEEMERISSMVRHDLRGPLQVIQSASYMIRSKPDRLDELTQKIDDSVAYAVKILDDLKAMARPESINRSPIELDELVEKSITDANIPANLRIVKRLTPLKVEVDQIRMRRIVDNLIKNAVEAMPDSGTLTVEIKNVDQTAHIIVKDTGRGLDDEACRNLFTPFYTTKPNGTGLGLAICKKLIEAHGGKITYESKLGEGTMFTVLIPLTSNAWDLRVSRLIT